MDGIIETWNSGAERLFGYTQEEAIGQSITLLIPPDRIDEEPKILKRIRRGEHVDHYESVRRRKDGSLLHVSLSISPIADKNGKIIAASKIARDIVLWFESHIKATATPEEILSAFDETRLTTAFYTPAD